MWLRLNVVTAALVILAATATSTCEADVLKGVPATPPGETAKKAAPVPSEGPAARKSLPVVAILNYETGTYKNRDLGQQIADLLTVRLSVEEEFELVERAKLDKILQEQKLKLTGLADQEKAVQVGKLLGAQIMIIGKTFTMDKHLIFVTKVVGVETGRVKGNISKVEPTKNMSEAIFKMSEDVAELIRKQGPNLLPDTARMPDPVAEIRKALGDRAPPTVAVIVPEMHILRIVVDPSVETEIKRTLVACGFTVVDTGRNDLADWAKRLMKGERAPWPAAVREADVIVVGEAFSEFALRTGDLVTCTGRAEINAIDRHTGRILVADRATQRAVDLNEVTAGKTALQKAGRKLGLAVCRRLVTYGKKKPAAEKMPLRQPAGGNTKATPHEPASTVVRVFAAPLQDSPAAETPKTSDSAAAPAGQQKPVKRTVFAVPLENETGEEQYDPAAAGLGDLVAVLLARHENVTVVERQRLLALTDEQAKSLKGLTGQKYAVAAGKLLKADTVLTGRLFLVQDKLTVSLQAIDIPTDRVVAADQVSFRPVDMMETALQLARKMSTQMAVPLPEIDLTEIDKSPVASLHFAKALSHYYAGNMDAAIMQFMRTMDLDPDYTEAHFWQGMCHQRLGEHAHAVIEWEKYVARRPDSERAAAMGKLLNEAKLKDAQTSPERLGPKIPTTSKPKERPAAPAIAKPAPKQQDPAERKRLLARNALQLGAMLEKAGKPDAARREYRRVITEYADTEFAKTAREKLAALDAKEKAKRQ